jgi:hypothetical protein
MLPQNAQKRDPHQGVENACPFSSIYKLNAVQSPRLASGARSAMQAPPKCKLFLPFDYLLSNPTPLPFAHFVLLAGLFPLQSTSRQRRRLVRDRCCLRDFLPLLCFVVCWVVAIFALQGLFGNISSHDHIRPAVFHNVKCLLESLVRPMLFMPHCDCHRGLYMLPCESFNGKVDGKRSCGSFRLYSFLLRYQALFQVLILPRRRFDRHVFAARHKRDYERYVVRLHSSQLCSQI